MKNKKGFTLVEILIAIAITSILIEVVFIIYHQNNQNYEVISAKTTLQKYNLSAIDKIRFDIKKSSQLINNYNAYSTSENSIILKIPRLDTNQVPIDNTFNYVIYRPNPGNSTQLQRIEVIDTTINATIINNYLDTIKFYPKDNLGNAINNNWEDTTQIKIDLSLKETVQHRSVKTKLTSVETMRNI